MIKTIKTFLIKYDFYISILVPISLVILRWFYPVYFEGIKERIGLEFYQCILLSVAMITLYWTNKRYQQSQRVLEHSQKALAQSEKQSKEALFSNKMNTLYLEVIKVVSDEELKKTSTASNMINAIQASIMTFYDNEKDRKKARKEILNFQNINFKAANLESVNLAGADLKRANLTKVILTRANLTRADLKFINLTSANLNHTYLTNTKLHYARFIKTDLSYAYLTVADLTNADLTGADLRSVNLTGAINLTQEQLDSAETYERAILPLYLTKEQ